MRASVRPSRRDFLRWSALAVPAAGLLTGCASGGGQQRKADLSADGPPDNPFDVAPDAPLEVVIFKGGFDDKYARFHQELYQKRFRDATIEHVAAQQIQELLQPRFVAGDPPDVVDNSGPQKIPVDGLVDDEQLVDLTLLLDAPSADDPSVPVRDTLLPGTVEAGSFGHGVYQLSYAYTVFGLWYSRSLFEREGWEYPRTWDDMMSLCAKIKAKGMAPWTYQGKLPAYITWPLFDLAVKHGGEQVTRNIDNLEDGAWQQESVLLAAEAMVELFAKGYILPGSEGLTQTEAQTRWNQGAAALIPCGSWLEKEQEKQTPEGFDMVVAPTPSLTSDDTLPFETLHTQATEPFIVPTHAENPQGGLEYLRIMLSKQGAKKFTELTASLTCVRGAADDLPGSSALNSVRTALNAAGDRVFSYSFNTWYSKLMQEGLGPAMAELMTGRVNAKQFTDRVQRVADEVKTDDSIRKYQRR